MWILAMAMAIVAVAASFTRLRKVRGALSFDLPMLTSALGRAGSTSRLAEMGEAMDEEGPTWERELLGVALATSDPQHRAALVSEALLDVGASLRWGAWIPVASARLAALG